MSQASSQVEVAQVKELEDKGSRGGWPAGTQQRFVIEEET